MRALVVYAHPVPESFVAAIRDCAVAGLERAGHEVRLIDLYAIGFDPAMGAEERRLYHSRGLNERAVADQIAHVRWCDMLIFVYPTWWYGLPAMMKGWLDRTLVPHVAFSMPEGNKPIGPLLTHIRKMAAITTCGSPWWWMQVVGEPGRRTLLRGVRALCHEQCRTLWMAHYKMDASTPDSRAAFLRRVEKGLGRF